jgi:enediyne biosynthesis protein E4
VRFEDVTLKAGLGRLPGPGLGVVCADFNGDGWPDIFVANDGQPNYLWVNQKDGTFKEEAVVRGLALNGLGQTQGNMGIALGDVDGDGIFDVFVTHLTEETHTLWKQGPRGIFQDRTAAMGLASPRWRGTGFGTVLADFDHDGALDLAIVNGRVGRGPPAGAATLGPFWSRYAQCNQLFVNDGRGTFRDISAHDAAFCEAAAVSRGLACADLNGDGALDLLVTTIAGPARLYRNIAPKRGHWLLVRALDPALRRDAYGAEVTVYAGGRRWLRCMNPGYSYLCSNDPRAHFGLGQAERVDAIEVIWPDGAAEAFPGQSVDQVVVLRKGEGKSITR